MSDASVPTEERGEARPASAGTRLRRRLFRVAKIGVCILVLTWLIRSGRLDLSLFGSIQSGERMLFLLAGFLVAFLALLLPTVRWYLLLRAQDVTVGFGVALRWAWIGSFLNTFVPGRVAGDVARAYYLIANTQERRLTMASTVLLDRAVGIHSLITMGLALAGSMLLFGSPAHSSLRYPALLLAVFFVILLAGVLTMTSRRISQLVGRMLPKRFTSSYVACASLYRNRTGLLLAAYATSLLNSLCNIAVFCLAGLALGSSIPFWSLGVIVPLVAMSNMMPISPGGLGVGETLSAELLAGLNVVAGGSVALLSRLLLNSWPILGGAPLWILSRKTPRK